MNFVIGAAYIPPSESIEFYEAYVSCLQSTLGEFVNLSSKSNLLLMGDYNIPGFVWKKTQNYSIASGYHNSPQVRSSAAVMSNFCRNYELLQLNDKKNCCGNILDIFMTDIVNIKLEISEDIIF